MKNQFSNFKITHCIKNPRSLYPELVVATFDYTTKGNWFRKPSTKTVTVYKEPFNWKYQETGKLADNNTQCWLDAQETLGKIKGNVQV